MYAAFFKENSQTLPVTGELIVKSHYDQDTTSLLALGGKSASGDTLSMLISNLNSTVTTLDINLKNLPWEGDTRIEWISLKAPDQRYTTHTSLATVNRGQVRFMLADAGSPSAYLIRFIRSQATPTSELPSATEKTLIAPNPASDWLELTFPRMYSERVVVLLDGQGRRIQQWAAPATQLQIDLKPFPSGTYILRIGMETIPFIKQ